MVTIMAPAKGYMMTTAETAGEATFDIPFTFAQPLVTCGLDFGTLINSTGGNDGYVQVDVTTDEGTTMIYYHQSVDENPAQLRSDNYKGDVPAPDVERLYAHLADRCSRGRQNRVYAELFTAQMQWTSGLQRRCHHDE